MKVKQGRISFGLEKENSQYSSTSFFKEKDENRKIHNSSLGFGGKNDPRSLNDKNFLDFCIQEIRNFLIQKNYKDLLPFEGISNLSGKNFVKIFLFLIKEIDPNFDLRKKAEEEIPLILRYIYYPFVPPKSILFSLNNPRVWPALVGCLKWMIELLYYDAQVFGLNSYLQEKRFFSNNSLWKQMVVAYYVFLSGKEEYRKYFQILWAVIKNKEISQKKKIRGYKRRFNHHQERFFFIYFSLFLEECFKGKTKKIKKLNENFYFDRLKPSKYFFKAGKFFNDKTYILFLNSAKDKRKKLEFSKLTKPPKINTGKTRFNLGIFSQAFKDIVELESLKIWAIKIKYFWISQEYLTYLSENLKFASGLHPEFFPNWKGFVHFGLKEFFSPEFYPLKLLLYYKTIFFSFFEDKRLTLKTFNFVLERIENSFFVFREYQYFYRENSIPKNFFKLSRNFQRQKEAEKDFQIFFQGKEGEYLKRILHKGLLVNFFFAKRIFLTKVILNGFKFLIRKEFILIRRILSEIKFCLVKNQGFRNFNDS